MSQAAGAIAMGAVAHALQAAGMVATRKGHKLASVDGPDLRVGLVAGVAGILCSATDPRARWWWLAGLVVTALGGGLVLLALWMGPVSAVGATSVTGLPVAIWLSGTVLDEAAASGTSYCAAALLSGSLVMVAVTAPTSPDFSLADDVAMWTRLPFLATSAGALVLAVGCVAARGGATCTAPYLPCYGLCGVQPLVSAVVGVVSAVMGACGCEPDPALRVPPLAVLFGLVAGYAAVLGKLLARSAEDGDADRLVVYLLAFAGTVAGPLEYLRQDCLRAPRGAHAVLPLAYVAVALGTVVVGGVYFREFDDFDDATDAAVFAAAIGAVVVFTVWIWVLPEHRRREGYERASVEFAT